MYYTGLCKNMETNVFLLYIFANDSTLFNKEYKQM